MAKMWVQGRRRPRGPVGPPVPAVIVGAGPVGQGVVARPGDLAPVGFVDDDPAAGTVCGLPVLGGTADLAKAAWQAGARTAVLALPSLSPVRLAQLAERAAEADLDVRCVGPGGVRDLGLSRLLGRAELTVAGPRACRFVAGRRVLITGAGGAIGARLARRLRTLGPAELHLLDTDAAALARLTRESPFGEPVTTDIRDAEGIDRLFTRVRPELVFHAASRTALEDPCAAIITNVLGTRTLVRAARRTAADRFVLLSTDLAADPVSVSGASRRLAELVLQGAAGGPTCFATVRVGDLLDCAGSVLSKVTRQVVAGEVITVPHPDVTRHFMTVREAAGLALETAAMVEDAETFALDTGPPTPVLELVGRFTDELRLPDVTIRFTGLGPGDRLRAKRFSDTEVLTRTVHPYIWATRATPLPSGVRGLLDDLFAGAAAGDAEDVRLLIRRILPEYRP